MLIWMRCFTWSDPFRLITVWYNRGSLAGALFEEYEVSCHELAPLMIVPLFGNPPDVTI